MVVSVNTIATPNEFNALLTGTVNTLNNEAKLKPDEIRTLAGNRLEPFVKEIMDELAIGTPFEGSIELISGQKFPDIVANSYYGIEVKTTTGNNWKSTGNSVLETTRVGGVERIYMLFGKLGAPIQFMSRRYEECLSEVVVTHSPRYLIDMELRPGDTIFDKMQITYDELRNNNPIKVVKEYYRQIARKQGNDVWWIDKDTQSNFIIRFWSSLTTVEREEIIAQAFVYFPEIYGNDRRNKYNRLASWLITDLNIICPNVRDHFSASGRVTFEVGGNTYKDIPQVLYRLFLNYQAINAVIKQKSAQSLSEYWGKRTTEKNKLNDWKSLAIHEATKQMPARKNEVEQIVNDIMG